MNKHKLPTFKDLKTKLDELDPSKAEVICAMIQNVLGLSSDIDGLLDVVELLAPQFSAEPWIGYRLSNQSRGNVDALLQLYELHVCHPGLITKTYASPQIEHTSADRPLMRTWQFHEKPFSPDQLQLARFLQTTLFIWRSQNPGQIPRAILEFCKGIRKLLNADIDADWPKLQRPDLWLSKLILGAEHQLHPLHKCLKGMNFVLESLKNSPAKQIPESIKFHSTKQSEVNQKSYFQNFGSTHPRRSRDDVRKQTPRLPQPFPIYSPPADGPDSEPSLNIWVRDDEGDAGGLEVVDQYARLREARYRTARENNFLPWDWHVLNHAELEVLVPLIRQENRPQFQIAIKLCLITIACGVDFRDLLNTRVVTEWDELPELQICTKSGEWRRKFPQFPGRFTPSLEQAANLHAHHEELTLPLPDVLLIHLESLQAQATIGQQFGFNKPEEIESCMQEWLTDQRHSHPTLRATPARLRRIIFDEGIRQLGDELAASLTINSAQFAPSVGFYYYSAPVSDLTKQYCKHLDSIGLSASQRSTYCDARFGSHLYIDAQWHAAQLQPHIDVIMSRPPLPMQVEYEVLRDVHEQMACYTAWLLQCATGHRAAEQFSFGMPTIDPTGWAILRDKVVDEAHRARLVRVSPLALEQIHAYCEHLRGLAQRLAKHNLRTAEQISRMSTLPGLQEHGCNWLFLLPHSPKQAMQKLGSAAVQNFLKLEPNLPSNLPRHWFISVLRERGLAGEWVSAAAGHIQAGQQSWSSGMTVSPSAIANQWDHIVDDWLRELGFKTCHGISVINKKRIPSSNRPTNLTALPPARASELAHKENMTAAKAHFKRSFSQHTFEELLDSEELQQRVFNTIAQSNQVTERQKRKLINALTRYIRRKKKLPLGGFVLNCPAEAAPFNYDHLLCVDRGNWLRKQLPECLPDDPSHLSLAELLAWAHLSLVIECGLITTTAALLAVPHGGLRHFNGRIWLQWNENQRLVRIWPGRISTLILLALHARPISDWPSNRSGEMASNAEEISWPQAEFNSAISNIIKKHFRFDHYCSAEQAHRYSNNISRIMQAWQQQYWSGLVSSYTRAETKAWAIPQDNLLRLLAGKRSILELQEDIDEDLASLQFRATDHVDQVDTRYAAKSLRDCIQNYIDGTSAGINSAQEVIAQIKLLESTWNEKSVGHIVFLLAHYAKILLSKKKKGKAPYKKSTVLNYVFGAGEPLIASSWADNILEYDSENFEEIYRIALNYNEKADSKKWRGKFIRYFHEFLIKNYDVTAVDFARIDPAFSGIPSMVNAQIIRYQEYLDARSLLREDSHATTEERILQELAIILTFRFALRISECLRLRICDVVFHDDIVILYIQRNKFGSPKSRAGFRQVPCWTLTSDEKELLQRRLDAIKSRSGNNGQSPIFCDKDVLDEIIPKARIQQRLLVSLKLASGNKNCRIHDARHTYASAITYLACRDKSLFTDEFEKWFPGGIERAQEIWLNFKSPTRRLMYALSVHLGHAQLGTTLESYTHSIDLCHASLIDQYQLKTPALRKLAAWVRITEAAIKVRRHRKDNDDQLWESLILDAIQVYGLSEVHTSFDYSELPKLPIRGVDARFNLNLLHMTIVGLKDQLPIIEITNNFGYSSEQVRLIELGYSELLKETSYKGFDAKKTDRYIDNLFYRTLTRKVEQFFGQSPINAEHIINIWRENYSHKIPGLGIADQQQQEKWSEFLLAIGAEKVCQSIRQSDHDSNSRPDLLIRNKKYPSQFRTRHSIKSAPVFFGQFHSSEESTPASRSLGQQELHHIMALSYIYYFVKMKTQNHT